MNPLFSHALGLGLLSTLMGAIGIAVPAQAQLPENTQSSGGDSSNWQTGAVPVAPSADVLSTVDASPQTSLMIAEAVDSVMPVGLDHSSAAGELDGSADNAGADSLGATTGVDSEDRAADRVLPITLPTAIRPETLNDSSESLEAGSDGELANRRENTELFESAPWRHQVPLNPPPTESLEPVTPAAEGAEYTLTVIPEREIQIPANGRSTLTVIGTITNAEGQPIDRDVVVTLSSTAGEFIGADYDTDRGGFQVLARQGQFEATLRSGLDAQQVTIQATADGREVRGLEPNETRQSYPRLLSSTQVTFFTDLRPTLISGVVDLRIGRGGTNLLGSFRDFLSPESLNRDVAVDVQAGIFGTGSIGDWLFTGAYNSQRGLNDRCDGGSLYRDVQFCDQTYAVYGDSSTTNFLTPSTDSLYLRFQRDSLAPDASPDYFMWGDYGTQEFAGASQNYTATVRELHGFKGNFTFGNGLQITALYGDNVRPFQRDTIAPDGTSGYYFLSRRLLLRGSENVFIETEEINRPGTVISREPLYRGVDYEIDYDRGTLLFRQPISAIDLNPLGTTLVRRIVATYQVDDPNNRGSLYAGRLQYRPSGDGGLLVGATLLTEDQGIQDFTLYGFDLLLPLGDEGQIVGEFARSSNSASAVSNRGNAYRLEIAGSPFSGVTGQAYYRSTDTGFSNTATSSFRPGQTRWGAQVLAQVGEQTQLRALVDQESNFGPTPAVETTAAGLLQPGLNPNLGPNVDNTLTEFRGGVIQQFGSATLGIDYVNRNRTDRIGAQAASSSQVVSRFNLPITGTLNFLAQSEINLAESDPLYPTRNTVGLEWALQPGVSLRLAQQFISGGQGPSSITSLDSIVSYDLDDNTTLTNRYSLLGGYNGITGQGAVGLNHRLVLAPGLRATVGFERIFGDAFNLTGAGQQFAQPFAVGSGGSALGLQASTTYSVGLEYTDNPNWQASGRVEYRDSPGSSNLVLGAAAAGRFTEALTGLARFELGNFANQTITDQLGNSSNLRLGLAYRNPYSDTFNGLFSYEFRNNPSSTPDNIVFGNRGESQDHTLALEGIYAPNWQWEFYGKYALRYSTANLAQDLGVSNSIHLAQFRANYRFAYRWDVGGEVRWIGQPTIGYNETGFAVEAGYYLTPDIRLGLGYSFGRANDGSFIGGGGFRSASGPYFGITAKVNQLFNGFGVQPISPPQQQDSYVDSVQAEAVPEELPSTQSLDQVLPNESSRSPVDGADRQSRLWLDGEFLTADFSNIEVLNLDFLNPEFLNMEEPPEVVPAMSAVPGGEQ